MLDALRIRRADRLLDGILAGLASVELGCVTRDLEKRDKEEPLLAGEIALGGEIRNFYVAVLLRRRGFARCGWNGGSGLHREPIYSLGHHPD